MTSEIKWSAFPNVGNFKPNDTLVGLRSGANVQFTIPATTNLSWSPVFTCSSPGDLSVAITSPTVAYYSINGNVVTLDCNLYFTPTFTTAAGTVMVTGLPYISSANALCKGALELSGSNWGSGYTSICAEIGANTNFFSLTTCGSGVIGKQLVMSNFTSGTPVVLGTTITYLL